MYGPATRGGNTELPPRLIQDSWSFSRHLSAKRSRLSWYLPEARVFLADAEVA